MLQLKQIHKRYGNKTVTDNINLEVAGSKLLAVLGRSGCRKSTLLKIIAGLVTPDNGQVWINGKNLTDVPPEQRCISLVFQDYALLPHLNTLQNIAFGLRMRGISQAEAYRHANDILAEVGLSNEARRYPEHLSGGEQQHIALARVLVIRPQLLFSLFPALTVVYAQLTAIYRCPYPPPKHSCRSGYPQPTRSFYSGRPYCLNAQRRYFATFRPEYFN